MSWFYSGAAQAAFRELQNPVARLGELPHWIAPARKLLASPVIEHESLMAYLPAGGFYSISIPSPGPDAIDRAVSYAQEASTPYVLYPVLRQETDRSALERAGFTAFPWFFESIYEMKNGWESDLRAQLGGDRFRDHRRILRKYESCYEPEFYFAADVRRDSSLIAEFDRLHSLNLKKYGHHTNFYSEPVLARLMSGLLGDRIVLCFSRDRASRQFVQAMLALLDRDSGEMHLLVQGIDAEAVPAGQNLYVAFVLAIYQWGAAQGVRIFNHGRGREADKIRLGSNRIHLLLNYLLPVAHELSGELRRLKETAQASALASLEQLRAEAGIPLSVTADFPVARS